MKKIVIIILLLSTFIIIYLGVELTNAFSTTPIIYYDGVKKNISFINDKNTDLFINLKELMPGDVKEQDILFKLNNVNKTTKVFLKIDNGDVKIPESISIKVLNNNTELAKKGEYIEIGTFTKDANINLKVIIDVPQEVGNEVENLRQNFEWKVLVQESDSNHELNDTDNINNTIDNNSEDIFEVPLTYDNNNIFLYIKLLILSIIIIICLILLAKKD